MNRQNEREFPSLVNTNSEQEDNKNKKGQKYEKNTNSVQLSGMNDMLGFYYEGNTNDGNKKQDGSRQNDDNYRGNQNSRQHGKRDRDGGYVQKQDNRNQQRQEEQQFSNNQVQNAYNNNNNNNNNNFNNNSNNNRKQYGGNQNANRQQDQHVSQNNNNNNNNNRRNQGGNQNMNRQQDEFDQILQQDINEYDFPSESSNSTYQQKKNNDRGPQQQQQQQYFVEKQPQQYDRRNDQYERKQEQKYEKKQGEQYQQSNNSNNNNNNSNNNNNYKQSQKQNKLVFVEKEPQSQEYNQRDSEPNRPTTSNQQYARKDQQQQQQYQQKQPQQGQVQYVEKQQTIRPQTAVQSQEQNKQSANKEQYVPKQQVAYVQKQQSDNFHQQQTEKVEYVKKQQGQQPKYEQQQKQQQDNKSKQQTNFVEKQNEETKGNSYQQKKQNQNNPQQHFNDNNNKNSNNSQKKGRGEKSELKAVNARLKEQEKQQASNEWSTDAKKFINEDQVFYLNEDKYYHQIENKYNGHKRGNLPKVVMVAEKPSIAKSIAEAISGGTSQQVKGYSKYLPVHEFEGTFQNKRVLFKITSVAGHVYGLDFTNENQIWTKVNPVNLFTARTIKVPANSDQSVIKHLEIEAQDASYLLLWLDNDREGENICFEVKGICERVMCYEGGSNVQVLRSKFSSLTKSDLVQAFKNIKEPPNMNESKATDARQIIDLKIGSAFTRYQTLFFRNKYPELVDNIISFGPCQTPTLGFCVAREDEILNFKPKLYYRVRLSFLTEDLKEVVSHCDRGHIFNQTEAQKIYSEIANCREVTIENVSSDNASKQRPEGLNTVALLKVGSSYLHISPMETMHIAERLYLSGYITYPRTESSAYPKTFDFNSVLNALGEDSTYTKYVSELLSNGYTKPRQGVDMGDHPPITPTSQSPGGLRGEEISLYDYIARHFIASLSEDCKYKKIAITAKLQGHTFIARGIQVVKKGFLDILESSSIGENAIQSNLKPGDKLQVGNASLEQEYTSAPGYITESELIGLMEKNSIGTDASMATHIQNICNRKYVEISGSNRSLVPTQLGRSLIHGFQKIDPDLVQPQIRAKIENLVDQIATGKKEFCDVINESMRIFQAKYLTFVENISKMDFLFESFCTTFEDTLEAAKPFSKCGKCKRFMKIIERAGKIICEKCDVSLSVPTNGTYKLSGEKICPLDGYQIVFFTSLPTPNVSFEVCPKCYTDSPLLDSDQVTCSICTNDACKYSINHRLLKECPKCQVGDIVIEPVVAQKLAAMCNECWTQWGIPIQTKDLKVSKEKKCGTCSSCLISFQHIIQKEKQQAPKPDQVPGTKEKQQKIIKFSKEKFEDVCLFCDSELQSECREVGYHESRKRHNTRRKKRN